MPRRVTVPATDDLFRPTVVPEPTQSAQSAESAESAEPAGPADRAVPVELVEPKPAGPVARTASGRVKHDEKMTIYVTSDELLDIEHARLELRRHHGLAVDRGRLVRAAVALALAELDARGAESALVQRLDDA